VPSQTDIDFGQIAVQNKLITKKQLDEALEALEKIEKQLKGKKGKKKPRLVDVLVQRKINCFGAGESAVEQKLLDLLDAGPHRSHLRLEPLPDGELSGDDPVLNLGPGGGAVAVEDFDQRVLPGNGPVKITGDQQGGLWHGPIIWAAATACQPFPAVVG